MPVDIAIATVSGKAYYMLVKELKRRNLPFLSLKPRDPVPLHIKVVITTKTEQHLITHPKVLIYESEHDAENTINKTLRVIQGIQKYDTVIIGVDPGKIFGIAIKGDGKLLRTITCSGLKETVEIISKTLVQLPARNYRVKIGNGFKIYKELLQSLDETLPKVVIIEIVSETGTSQHITGIKHRRGLRDVAAATKITRRKGKIHQRNT